MKLRELAYSRSGDKGEVSNICVFVYDPADYPKLAERLTAEVVQEHFGALVRGPVTRYEIPTAHGLNFVLVNVAARQEPSNGWPVGIRTAPA